MERQVHTCCIGELQGGSEALEQNLLATPQLEPAVRGLGDGEQAVDVIHVLPLQARHRSSVRRAACQATSTGCSQLC